MDCDGSIQVTLFAQFHIIPKINSENDERVKQIVAAVRAACVRSGSVENTDVHGLDALVIAIGGDGTMLQAMRYAVEHNCYALGINLGRVGFLTEISVTDSTLLPLVNTIEDVLSCRIATFPEWRSMLHTEIDGQSYIAGNDIAVAQVYSDSMLCYRLQIGGMDAGVHRANAILASTATGSTAYSLSAGGALMMPNLRSIQLVPVAPLTMTSRPILVPEKTEIKITAWGGEVAVRCDGQVVGGRSTVSYTQDQPFEITVKAHEHCAKIIHLKGWNFFDVLTQKLGWQKE